jgi:hypothetical protein
LIAPLIARVASLCSLPNSLSALTEPEFFFLPTALKGGGVPYIKTVRHFGDGHSDIQPSHELD